MANQFLDAQEYSNVMLLLLKNQLVMGRLVDGQFKNEVTDQNGLTINVKRPPRFLDKKDGTAALATQDIVTGTAPVKVDQYSKVHVSVGDIEYVSSYNSLMQNATMRSAASTLAHSIDGYLMGLTKKFHSWVAGTDPGDDLELAGNSIHANPIRSPSQAMAAHTRLMSQGVPNESLSAVVTFEDGQAIRGTMQTNDTERLNVPALQKVRIPIISEIDWYATQQIPTLTMGTRAMGNGEDSGAQVDGGTQNTNYRAVKGTAGDGQMTQEFDVHLSADGTETVNAGEVFTIEGVFAYDWRAQQALDHLQQFTVVEDATAVSGDVTLTISPPIIVPGTGGSAEEDVNTAFGTVDSVPADDAYIQFVGAGESKKRIRSAFHKRAISMVSARLHMPFTGTASYAVDPDTGIAVRYWRGSDIDTGDHIHRWDCLYGGAVLDPFLGTRIAGPNTAE